MAKKKKKEKEEKITLKSKVKFKKITKKEKPLKVVIKRPEQVPYRSIYFKEEYDREKNLFLK